MELRVDDDCRDDFPTSTEPVSLASALSIVDSRSRFWGNTGPAPRQCFLNLRDPHALPRAAAGR